jgi:multiple sugar transport system substrate-binding protein
VIPFDTAHDKIATAIAGDQAPDVSQVGTTWLSEFAGHRRARRDTDRPDRPGPVLRGVVEHHRGRRTSFGAPWYTETRLIYYRKDLAEKAGVTPSEGWSQEDLKAFAKAMQDEAGAKWGISLQPGGTGSWQSLMPFAWQRGAEVVDGDQFSFDTPEMQEALDYYASFFSEGISPTELAEGGQEAGSSAVTSARSCPDHGTWASWPTRAAPGSRTSGPWRRCHRRRRARPSPAGGDLVVFKNSENRDTAWKFVDFLTQDPAAAEAVRAGRAACPRCRAPGSPARSPGPAAAAFGTQLQDAKSAPAVATWEEVAAPLDDAIEQVALGASTAEEALASAEQKANNIGFGS